jgi:hypothetical protein
MWEWFLIVFLAVAFGLMTFVAYRFYRKCVVYDEVFQFLSDDIVANLQQFQRMMTSNVMSEEPEVKAAHKNMLIMGKRFNEILQRMEEATGLDLRPPPIPPRPKFK